MTKEETAKLLSVMKATYSNFHFDNPQLALEAWWRILEPDDYQLIMDAFVVYARTDVSGFAPTAGKLHMLIADKQTETMTDGEIIGMLSLASRNANYGSEQEFAKLPKLLQRVVGSPTTIRNWGVMEKEQLDYTFNQMARTYKSLVEAEKKEKAAQGLRLQNIQIEAEETPVIEDKNVIPFRRNEDMSKETKSRLDDLYRRFKNGTDE